MPRPNGVCRLKSRSLFVSHSGNLHSVVLTNAWAFATPLARGPCSPSIDNFSKDSLVSLRSIVNGVLDSGEATAARLVEFISSKQAQTLGALRGNR